MLGLAGITQLIWGGGGGGDSLSLLSQLFWWENGDARTSEHSI